MTNTKSILAEREYPFAQNSRMKNSDANLVIFNTSKPSTKVEFTKIKYLTNFLDKGDLIVVNDSAVLPASFQMIHNVTGKRVEIRLLENLREDPSDPSLWKAYVFGDGDWRIKTEDRSSPPFISEGDCFKIDSLNAHVESIDHQFPDLVTIKFYSQFGLWDEIYKYGKLIQYSYLIEELSLWDQQTIFASHPVSVEAPSASFQLTWELIFELLKKRIEIVPITHAISLSSTGNKELDALLPFPEKYWISEKSANRINKANSEGRQIIAFGTSAMRAVETSVENGFVISGAGRSELRIDACFDRKIFTGILTGMHVPGETHLDLLTNFIDRDILFDGYEKAVERGFLWHEYGDLSLVLT